MDRHFDDDGDCVLLTVDDKVQLADDIRDIDSQLADSHDSAQWRALKQERRQLVAELAAGRRLPVLDEQTFFDHEILARPPEEGGGWRLRLLEDDKEVNGGVFSVAAANEEAAESWWSTLDVLQQEQWAREAGSSMVLKAYMVFLTKEAWHDAVHAAGEWLDSRPG